MSSGIYNIIYLHNQWADQAHTLQFGSTDEYFETVEYEPRSALELRDSSRKPLMFLALSHPSNTLRHYREPMILLEISEISPASLQINLARSSRGVGRANKYYGIVIVTRAVRCARFWDRKSPPNMFSDSALFFFLFCNTRRYHLVKSSDRLFCMTTTAPLMAISSNM